MRCDVSQQTLARRRSPEVDEVGNQMDQPSASGTNPSWRRLLTVIAIRPSKYRKHRGYDGQFFWSGIH
jgi:hypothetical protein